MPLPGAGNLESTTIGTMSSSRSMGSAVPILRKCESITAASSYLRDHDVPDSQFRLFRSTFTQLPNFTPNPLASFNNEISHFVSSHQLGREVARKAKFDGICNEIIEHYLPEGVRLDRNQVHEDDNDIELGDEQTLEIYQAMCRAASKPVCHSIDTSLLELKSAPYVNIMDFIDSFRRGRPIRTFDSWEEFKEYTLRGRRMDMTLAQDSEFLAPLLQDLNKGPNAVDPRAVRHRLVQEGAKRRRARELARRATMPIKTDPDLPRSLSPSVFDLSTSISRSPSLASRSPPPNPNDEYRKNAKGTFPSPTSSTQHPGKHSDDTDRQSAPSTPMSEISDSDMIEASQKVEVYNSSAQPSTLPFVDSEPRSPPSTPMSEISDSVLMNGWDMFVSSQMAFSQRGLESFPHF